MVTPLTFLFTDLENSTRLWEKAPSAMRIALARYETMMRAIVEDHNGRVVKMTGDGHFAVFASAVDGVLAALSAQLAMLSEDWPEETGPLKVRMGLHSGQSQARDGDYFGSTVNLAARIMDTGHGGQILLSDATRADLLEQKDEGFTFSDLGSYKLKGLVQPVVIFQLNHPQLAAEFPPLRSTAAHKHNFPSQLTPLFGRDQEIKTLSGLLADPRLVLVSIVAPGGMGKSRLAVALGKKLVDSFRDGVFLVELAPISDSANIVPAVAEAAGYQFQQNGRSQKQQILNYLENKQLLLILDNYEHLLDGAGLVTELLRAASGLKILVTSRQRLNQPGETLFTLQGLPVPGAENTDGEQSAAVQLFEQTARRASPSFALTGENLPHIIEICRLVQGMPLGIVLAAPWINVLTAAEIVEEIQRGLDILEMEGSELPNRQRSIRVVFDQAWSMMSAAEQQAFMKLTVFRGGFTREAAQNVAGARLRQLQTLLNMALLDRDSGSGRYHVHELLRQYAQEKLVSAGLYRQTQKDHAAFYLNYLARQSTLLKGAEQLVTLKLIEIDFDNIREAWIAAVNEHDYDLLQRAYESMYVFCFLQSRLDDGKSLFGKARMELAPAPGEEPHPVWLAMEIRFYSADSQEDISGRLEFALQKAYERDDQIEAAYCLSSLAAFAHYVEQNPAKAIQYYRDCAAIYRDIGENYYLAQTLSKLGEAYQLIGETDLTVKFVEEAYHLQHQIGDKMGESETLRAMGMTTFQMGDYDATEDHLENAYDIQLQTDYLVGQASSNLFRGYTGFLRGEVIKGRLLVELGLEQALDIADYSTQAWCYAFLSILKAINGDQMGAEEDLLRAEAVEIDPFRQTGAGNPFLQLHINMAKFLIAVRAGNMQETKKYLRQPLNLAIMTSSQPYMTIFAALGVVMYARCDKLRTAVELLALVSTMPIQITAWTENWLLFKSVQSQLREALSPSAFEEAWEQGKDRDLAATAQELLQEIGQSSPSV